jgi:hypothetical protein
MPQCTPTHPAQQQQKKGTGTFSNKEKNKIKLCNG